MGHVVERAPFQLATDAALWVRESPERWARLLDLLDWFTRRHPGRRLRRGDIWVYAQQRGMTVTQCEEFRFDNSLWSPLSRYAIMTNPSLVTVIRPRRCGLDTIDMRAVWELVGNDGSSLALGDWREAVGCRPASR